jgi:AraC-like DNA-binding protein
VLTRLPRPLLLPYVETFWAIDGPEAAGPERASREHVLPTGHVHLAFRLSGGPLRLFEDGGDRHGRLVSAAVVGGAREAHYIRDVSRPTSSVGAQLRPGAAEALFGVTAEELAGRHTPLDELWGPDAAWMSELLADAPMLHQRIDRLEALLAARLAHRPALHPAVSTVLDRLRPASSIRLIVQATGYSHRTVAALFRRSVGLTPKQYARVMRFQRAIRCLSGARSASLVDVAIEAGYSDQAHFTREFKAFGGITPTEYRRARPEAPHHVGIGAALR